jgi:NADP-dependent 3-hydroxy acid dehydrogenase YdfG
MEILKGKTAVVTGGGSGIGRALAQRFHEEGMNLVLGDIDESALQTAEAELAADGASVVGLRTDVSGADDLEALAHLAYDSFGATHVLCNNAGVAKGGTVWEATEKDWEWLLSVNLWGVIHGIRAFIPRMIAQGDECHVVNTSSGAGLHTRPFLGVYGATKHAVVAISEAMFHELRLTGIEDWCFGAVSGGSQHPYRGIGADPAGRPREHFRIRKSGTDASNGDGIPGGASPGPGARSGSGSRRRRDQGQPVLHPDT